MITDTPVIHMQNVTLQRAGTTILRDVLWRVRRGEHWALVGPNGSGKTSLLKMAAGTLWPSRGQVSVLGHRFGEVDLRELRKCIGWVSSAIQQRMPPSLEALRAVTSGAFASIGLHADPVSDQWDRARQLMDRLDISYLTSRKWGVLSLGEQQRVLIARALLADPPLLILDEPCAGLDLAAREQLLEMVECLARAQEGRTLVMVSHHIEEVTPAFTHTMVLAEGRIRARGPSVDVLNDRVLSDAFGLGIHVERAGGRFWAKIDGAET